jgi:hypothetical protein
VTMTLTNVAAVFAGLAMCACWSMAGRKGLLSSLALAVALSIVAALILSAIIRPPQLAASFISGQAGNVACWPFCDLRMSAFPPLLEVELTSDGQPLNEYMA